MIKSSKQNWAVGAGVKVGFLSLVVRAALATPGDGFPDAYILSNQAGTQLYKFVPHNGLEKLSLTDARELIADAHVTAERIAAAAIAKSQRDLRTIREINDVIFSEVA